jgi:hypothetical protein
VKAALTLSALAAAAAVTALPAAAQQSAPRDRIARIVVFGNDPCPRIEGSDDIVVCARRPESERYRIPPEMRTTDDNDPESTSWAVNAQSLEYAGRTGIQSCSTVGPGGFTGCWAELMRAARNDRRVEGEPGR